MLCRPLSTARTSSRRRFRHCVSPDYRWARRRTVGWAEPQKHEPKIRVAARRPTESLDNGEDAGLSQRGRAALWRVSMPASLPTRVEASRFQAQSGWARAETIEIQN